jgi:DNA-binding transcriptional MerR regulator
MLLAKELPLLNIKLKAGLVLPTPLSYTIIRYSINDILDSDFIEELKNAGLELREVQMFISPPDTAGKIHIDGHQLDIDAAAINFVLNNNVNWEMQWFTVNDLEEVEQLTSSGNTSYIPLTNDQCTLHHIFKSVHPFVVQIGVAHRVVNLSNKHRYCISLRFKQNDFSTILKNANRYSTEI